MFLTTKVPFSTFFAVKKNIFRYLHKTPSNEIINPKRVHQVYIDSAPSYDRIVDLTTFGQHNYWKWELVKMINPGEGTRLLDCNGGQGAISIRCLKYITDANIKDCELSVCDVNDAMMEQGKKKLSTLSNCNPNGINWIQGDAQKLPFPNESFNIYVISLGFRGINIQKTFEEAYRVLKPGSLVYCLEVYHPDNFAISCVHWFGFKYVVPLIGAVLFRTYKPFVYFVEEFQNIPNKQQLKTIIENAGFLNVSYRSLSWGSAAIHWGCKA